MTTDTTCRYYTDGLSWRVDFMDGGRTPTLRDTCGAEPEWLRRILDVARVGGHIGAWRDPAGRTTQSAWFRIDANNQLTEFVTWIPDKT